MKNMSKFTTERLSESTHCIDDTGCIYWITAEGQGNNEVASLFLEGYDGDAGAFEVVDLESGNADTFNS